ncbi:alpha/beta hydrolase-like protein [Lepidopterella palustris CBS 459.81]|uniref:Alpha/beta hydrolase-like protein n=1 Tax=Lepidopterella palustris CBS 459.81 TaxID=1314670 RepID=A0A8E2EKS5_9PEZI|nr:alpha/beta hydrolase-like protein [Lepidopterella palustris CBS 459.81]
MAPTLGILYVTMQPKDDLPISQFHDWYNNEHGPGRLRLPFVTNGFRYHAIDLSADSASAEKPEWMAIYDIQDMEELMKEPYTKLRQPPVQSQRERDSMKKITVNRKFYDFIGEVKGDGFRRLEDVEMEGEGNVMVAVFLTLHPGKENNGELAKWYSEEHVPMLSKVPGWLRTRQFITSTLERKEGDSLELLSLHEYSPQNGLGGEEFKAAMSTKWNDEIYRSVVREERMRTYDLYYTFGPAPRDLSVLESKDTFQIESTDRKTRTTPESRGRRGAIESFATTKDGIELPYRLEGSSDPQAPLIVLSNSILVEWGIWDSFVDAFLSDSKNKKYRILRYHTRGRSSNCSTQPVTMDLLASDVIALLDALRIPKAAAVIGVSLGGATALNAGLKYPERIAAFVACDTNALAPSGNKKAWGERIEIAEKEGAQAQSGEKVVGEQLAEMTVRRWFMKETYDGGKMEAEIGRVKKMVESNSLEGFKESVQALYEYDFRPEMKEFAGKGAFLVGEGDGVLPDTMKEMSNSLGKGASLFLIPGAGHLPMVEKPENVAHFVTMFLGRE